MWIDLLFSKLLEVQIEMEKIYNCQEMFLLASKNTFNKITRVPPALLGIYNILQS